MRRHGVAWLLLIPAVLTGRSVAAQHALRRDSAAAPAERPVVRDSTVPVVAVGDGATFAQALAAAVRMAVESGAGAAVHGSISTEGERVVHDAISAVSRGVVTRYVVLDSALTSAGAHVRILARVSRIAEREAVAARAERLAVPGALWSASAEADSTRSTAEGQFLYEVFGTLDRQPNAYAYAVEAGPPVPNGGRMRLRLRMIRTPSTAYAALAERAAAVLAALAGPAGDRTVHVPMKGEEVLPVRPCVSRCGEHERRLLDVRSTLDATDSLGGFDPPVVSTAAGAPVASLFPDLRTVGGFVVRFDDSTHEHAELTHVRSTRGFLTVVDYLRTTFDDARVRLVIGDRTLDLLESFRAPWSGQPQHRFATTAPAGTLPIALVRGFRPHTVGGPGTSMTVGSPYMVLALPKGDSEAPDTALVDIWLTPKQVSALAEIEVAPLPTSRRFGTVACRTQRVRWASGEVRPVRRCDRPAPIDAAWRPLDDEARNVTSSAGVASPVAAATPSRQEPVVPVAVREALERAPLREGDGAVFVGEAVSQTAVAVGTGVVDRLAPTNACAVARLRAQRELVRLLVGSRLDSRIALSTSERGKGQVDEAFHEEITEAVAGKLAGAALAAQWMVAAPGRCRVALWIAGGR
ncbi:MAG: hypothetical protein ACHQQ3_13430 [Gemmatimonadales bacterium]